MSLPVDVKAPLPTIPASESILHVSIIDSTAELVSAAGCSVKPTLPGQPYLNAKTYVFLLEHPQLRTRILFDGGLRVDWWNSAPNNVEFVESDLPGLRVTKNINELLREGGIDDQSVDAIIWSHHHFDHIGDASLFPPSTKIVVGPGFEDEFLPGYPTREDADILDADLFGRQLHEIDFKQNPVTIGDFRAQDYFNDGSLYILDTPGHDIGHLSALVRTTPDTFIFLGGDICDAPQVWRPTLYNPLPDHIPHGYFSDPHMDFPSPKMTFAPCHRFHEKEAIRTSSFSLVSDSEDSFYEDPATAHNSVEALKLFDAMPNVFVAVAHDSSLAAVVKVFPEGTMNEWKEGGWKEKAMWQFLGDLPVDGKVGRDMVVDGVYRGEVLLRSARSLLETVERDQAEEERKEVKLEASSRGTDNGVNQ